MTGYITGTLADPDGAEELLRTAEQSLQGRRAARLPAAQRARHRSGRPGPAGRPGRRRDPGDVADRRSKTLTRLAELGERAGRVFTLENLNTAVDHPGTPFAKAADTLALVEAVDSPHLRLNLDLYHAQIGEGNLVAAGRARPAGDRRDPGRRRPRALRAGHRRDPLPGGRGGPGPPRLRRRRRPRGLGLRRPRSGARAISARIHHRLVGSEPNSYMSQ